MILRDFYIRNDQDRFLRSLPGKNSEHVRAALDDYKNKWEALHRRVSQSLSSLLSPHGRSKKGSGTGTD